MEPTSGRQTRKKSYPNPQTTSFQPPRASNDKPSAKDKPVSSSVSPENSPERKAKSLKPKRKNEAMALENTPTEPSSSEFPPESQKQAGNISSIYADDSKATSMQREKKSPGSGYSDEISEETKKQIEMLFEIAQSSASKGDYQQAINIYNKIVKLNEKSTPAWIAVGHCYAVLGENHKALASYQQALSLTPNSQKDDQLWYGIGLLYQKIEDWKNAETSFKNALKLNPSSAIKGEILYNLGTLMMARGELREGSKLLMSSILLGSFSIDKMVEILCCVGQAQEEMNEVGEAMKTYKHALTLDENNLKALQCTGWLSFQLDRTNEALDYLMKAGLINEDDTPILYMKARCYLKMKQHSKAYDCVHRCITKEPSNSMYWCSLGILFAEMNQLKSAHECFSNALKFNPKSPENFFNMGCLYELCYQLEDAFAMHEKALELQPNFQLAEKRKLGIYAQLRNEPNSHFEVQFKHHKFTLSLNKDITIGKPSNALLGNQGGTTPQGSDTKGHLKNINNDENLIMPPNNVNAAKQIQGQAQLQGTRQQQQQQQQQKPQAKPIKEIQQQQQLSGTSPLLSLLPQGSQPLSLAGLTTPLKPQEHQQHGLDLGLLKNIGIQELSASDKEYILALADRLHDGDKEESASKAGKGIVQPIVLRHDPQGLGQGENGGKVQQKSGFKLSHKAPKNDEEGAPVKKVKTETGNPGEALSPMSDKQEGAVKKGTAVVPALGVLKS